MRDARARVLAPLRVLLPTWRFFDDVGFGLLLAVRVGPDADALGPWLPLPPSAEPVRRGLAHVLFDAHGNLRLAHRSLLDRLAHDVSELSAQDDPCTLASYAQVLALARDALRAHAPSDGAGQMQFQLTQPTENGEVEQILRSAVHPLRGA